MPCVLQLPGLCFCTAPSDGRIAFLPRFLLPQTPPAAAGLRLLLRPSPTPDSQLALLHDPYFIPLGFNYLCACLRHPPTPLPCTNDKFPVGEASTFLITGSYAVQTEGKTNLFPQMTLNTPFFGGRRQGRTAKVYSRGPRCWLLQQELASPTQGTGLLCPGSLIIHL